MVDSIIVGQYVGADALAAVGATGSLNFLIFSLCGGMANGTGVVISQHFGAGKNDQVKNTIINAAYIMLFCAVLMGGIGVIFARKILIFLNTPDNILDSSTLYMTIICCGILGVSLYNAVSAILRAVGDSKTPLYFLMVSSVVNIVLDLLFIRGFSWGVAGAAFATIIAQLISGIGSLIFALVKNPFFRIEKKYRSLNRGIIWQCIRMGVPLAFQSSLIAISCVALQSVVNTFGSVVVAAFTATSRIEQLVQQPYNSLGMSVSTYTGQNIGAGQLERVKKGYRIAFLLMAVFSFTMLPLAQFFGNPIMRLFVSEPEVIEMGAHALKLTSWFYLPLGMGVRSVPVEQPLFLIGNTGIARERVAELSKDRAQLRLRDRRLGEDDRLAPAVRGRDLLDRKRIAHRIVDVALAHGAHHSVYIQCDLIHGIPP